jgi:hypothetical protein
MENKVDRILEEVRRISERVTKIEDRMRQLELKYNETQYDVNSVRKNVDYFPTYLKEIQKALAIIYKNTDELEENVIEPGQRKTY